MHLCPRLSITTMIIPADHTSVRHTTLPRQGSSKWNVGVARSWKEGTENRAALLIVLLLCIVWCNAATGVHRRFSVCTCAGILFCEFIHFVLAMAFEWDGQPLWFAVQQHMICMAIVLHCEARHGGAQQICHIVRHGGVATSASSLFRGHDSTGGTLLQGWKIVPIHFSQLSSLYFTVVV
jgi:hypothetical protein